MSATPYPFGQEVRLGPFALTDPVTGQPIDPATITLTVQLPDGSTTSPSLTHDGTGIFHADYLPPLAGHYAYRCVSTLPNTAFDAGFDVMPALFAGDAGVQFVPSGYLTVAEFKALPTGVTFDDLIRSGSARVNDAELANILIRASRWADTYCQVPLGATTTTSEHQTIRIGRDGLIKISPRMVSGRIPLVNVTRVAYGYPGMLLSTINPTWPPWVQDGAVFVPGAGQSGPWVGPPIQFGPPASGPVWVEYDYVSGFPQTWLTSGATVGATSLPVADATGIVPGQSMRIHDPGLEEQVTVASTWTLTTGPASVPLASATQNAHATAVGVGAMPEEVKLAVAQIAVTIIRRSADSGVVGDFGAIGPGIDHDAREDMPDYTGAAAMILEPYRRIGPD